MAEFYPEWEDTNTTAANTVNTGFYPPIGDPGTGNQGTIPPNNSVPDDYIAGNYGTKSSAVDAGLLGQEAFDDDWEYKCTQSGTAGHAIWKKKPLMRTQRWDVKV